MAKKQPIRTELDDALVLAIGRMRAACGINGCERWSCRRRRGSHCGCRPTGRCQWGQSLRRWCATHFDERGLAVRAADPNDRRVKLLVITDKGQRMIEVMDAPLSGEFEGINTLNEEERHTLAALLRRAFSSVG